MRREKDPRAKVVSIDGVGATAALVPRGSSCVSSSDSKSTRKFHAGHTFPKNAPRQPCRLARLMLEDCIRDWHSRDLRSAGWVPELLQRLLIARCPSARALQPSEPRPQPSRPASGGGRPDVTQTPTKPFAGCSSQTHLPAPFQSSWSSLKVMGRLPRPAPPVFGCYTIDLLQPFGSRPSCI